MDSKRISVRKYIRSKSGKIYRVKREEPNGFVVFDDRGTWGGIVFKSDLVLDHNKEILTSDNTLDLILDGDLISVGGSRGYKPLVLQVVNVGETPNVFFSKSADKPAEFYSLRSIDVHCGVDKIFTPYQTDRHHDIDEGYRLVHDFNAPIMYQYTKTYNVTVSYDELEAFIQETRRVFKKANRTKLSVVEYTKEELRVHTDNVKDNYILMLDGWCDGENAYWWEKTRDGNYLVAFKNEGEV